MKTKICSQCKRELLATLEYFYEKRKGKYGLESRCKKCIIKNSNKYYKKNKEKVNKYNQKNKEKIKARAGIWRRNNYHRYWASLTTANHRKRGYKIHILAKEIENLAKETEYCPICNIKLNWTYKNKNGVIQLNSPTLDRINNENELNINNVQILCYKCNLTKNDKTMKEFVDYCTMVSKKFKEGKQK